ncbi:MAG: NOL1/NOP2/sun family putative RNA methylase, partial [Candidatus Peribacteraceae bacterium]
MHPFDRYAAFTDLKLLLEASSRSLRKSKRVNTLKCSAPEFQHWARAKKWAIEPVPWCPEGFFVDRPSPPVATGGLRSASRENQEEDGQKREAMGKDLLHILGYTYMQEAASMLPVVLLDPKPGETVLDMSAAPGSKATQIVARMNNAGMLIANDVQEKRIWALLSNLQRCGAINTLVTRKVGQWFAGHMTECFDRILCDAPCTAQGTVRKDSDALMYCSMENTGKMARLQRELLESAIHATKVGGRIVYSTCTLTPEENEGVVMSILNKFSDQVFALEPTKLQASHSGMRSPQGLRTASGELQAKYFDRAIEDSIKVQSWMK